MKNGTIAKLAALSILVLFAACLLGLTSKPEAALGAFLVASSAGAAMRAQDQGACFGLIIDPKNAQTPAIVRYPVAIGANANVIFDLKGYVGMVDLFFAVGVGTGTAPTYSAYFQSGTESNGANATNATTVNTAVSANAVNFTNANGTAQISVNTRSVGRYLSIIGTVGGSATPLLPVGIVAIGTKQVQP